jgi:hypothetical protein
LTSDQDLGRLDEHKTWRRAAEAAGGSSKGLGAHPAFEPAAGGASVARAVHDSELDEHRRASAMSTLAPSAADLRHRRTGGR